MYSSWRHDRALARITTTARHRSCWTTNFGPDAHQVALAYYTAVGVTDPNHSGAFDYSEFTLYQWLRDYLNASKHHVSQGLFSVLHNLDVTEMAQLRNLVEQFHAHLATFLTLPRPLRDDFHHCGPALAPLRATAEAIRQLTDTALSRGTVPVV